MREEPLDQYQVHPAARYFRRGPWENLATVIIAAGVVMLMQPFSIGALHLVLRHHSRRHGDVRHRQPFPGVKAMAEIRVENLHKAFGDFVAVRDSTFTVDDGEFFVMLGPSGCGKTTTLRMIAGLELPTSGRILLGGEDVTFNRAAARDIAFVFQLFALYPHMNVRQNIGFPLKCQGMPRRDRASASRRRRASSASTISSTSRCRGLPAATASASRSAAPSCAGRWPS